MKLASINIEHNLHTETVLAFLKKENPDIVCMQELLEEDVPLYEKELRMKGVFQCWSYINHPIRLNVKGKRQGVGIFAKDIVDSGSVFYEGTKDNILKSFEEYLSDEKFQKNYAFVWATVKNTNGNLLKVITTHLPVTKEGSTTPYQLKVIDSLLLKLENSGEFILCGDTNAPRGSEPFSRIAKKYKDNIPLEYKTSVDQNLHRVKGLQYMIDCLFTTPAYKASNVRLQDGVSDHMAVVAEITQN